MSGYNNTISAALRNQSRYYYSRVNAWLFRSYSQPVAITPIFNAILIRKKICNSALMRDASANRYNRRILSRVSSVRDHASLRVHLRINVHSVVIPRDLSPFFHQSLRLSRILSPASQLPRTVIVGYRTLRRHR